MEKIKSTKPLTPSQIDKLVELLRSALRKINPLSSWTQDLIEHHWPELKDELLKAFTDAVNRVLAKTIKIGTLPFHPADNWKVIEQNEHSLKLNEIKISDVIFGTCLAPGGEEILTANKRDYFKQNKQAPLDARFRSWLWKEKDHKTLEWLYNTYGIDYLDFFGTIIHDHQDDDIVLSLVRYKDGHWQPELSVLASISSKYTFSPSFSIDCPVTEPKA